MNTNETKMLRLICLMQKQRKDLKPGVDIYKTARATDLPYNIALETIWSLQKKGAIEIGDNDKAIVKRPGA